MFIFLLRFFIICLCSFGAPFFVYCLTLFLKKRKIKKHHKPGEAAELKEESVLDDKNKR